MTAGPARGTEMWFRTMFERIGAWMIAHGAPLLDPEPGFAAAALRPSLSSVVLTADHWLAVAVGGALLENNAIRSYAIARCAGASDVQIARLGSGETAADLERRAALARVMDDSGETRSPPTRRPGR